MVPESETRAQVVLTPLDWMVRLAYRSVDASHTQSLIVSSSSDCIFCHPSSTGFESALALLVGAARTLLLGDAACILQMMRPGFLSSVPLLSACLIVRAY